MDTIVVLTSFATLGVTTSARRVLCYYAAAVVLSGRAAVGRSPPSASLFIIVYLRICALSDGFKLQIERPAEEAVKTAGLVKSFRTAIVPPGTRHSPHYAILQQRGALRSTPRFRHVPDGDRITYQSSSSSSSPSVPFFDIHVPFVFLLLLLLPLHRTSRYFVFPPYV